MKPWTRALALPLLATLGGCSGGTDLDGKSDMAAPRPDLTGIPAADLSVPPGADLAGSGDLAGQPDIANFYTPATIHEIDTDPGNGPFGNGKLLSLERVVAVTDVDKYVNATNQQCRYQIWVQDPMCMVPPCGMVLKAIGPMAPRPDSTGKDCPGARISGTLLANIGRGDNVQVAGKVLIEVDSVNPMTVVEHQLFVDVVTPIVNSSAITPLVISDAMVYGQFVTHLGTTWNKYEGMYLTLAPSMGTLQISGTSDSGFQTIPGNTNWGDTFDNDYIPNGVPAFPSVGSAFKAISGVVSCRHGGEINPTRNKDFVP